jgi:hypothetical protein
MLWRRRVRAIWRRTGESRIVGLIRRRRVGNLVVASKVGLRITSSIVKGERCGCRPCGPWVRGWR